MKKNKLLVLVFFVGLAIFGLANNNSFAPTVIASSAGPPVRTTGAPGESTCASCHFGGSGGIGQFTITAPPRYIPGQTYQIDVRHTNADVSRRRWGFQLTSLAGDTAAGSFANLAATTNSYSSGGRNYVQHTSAGTFFNQTGGAVWSFNWTAPASNVGAVTFYAAGNQADGNGATFGDQIYTTNTTVQPAKNVFDFDGDGKSDISVFRDGVWHLQRSQLGFTAIGWGVASDKIAPADFDGDGKTDLTVYRPSNGEWSVLRSLDNTIYIIRFGAPEDLPRPADFDGDGKADICVWRPSNGVWYRLNSSDGQFAATAFGQAGDAPLVADFDGDGKSDIAVYRPSNGVWYWLRSSDNQFAAVQFGASEDKSVAADYDGDGKTDVAVFRPSNGVWYRLNSGDGSFFAVQFGQASDLPTLGDYDGDGRADIAVFRPSNGVWYLQQTSNGFTGIAFGASGDKPIPNAFVP